MKWSAPKMHGWRALQLASAFRPRLAMPEKKAVEARQSSATIKATTGTIDLSCQAPASLFLCLEALRGCTQQLLRRFVASCQGVGVPKKKRSFTHCARS